MTISRNEEWVQIAELDEDDQIHFTAAFRKLMNDLDWEAKAFVGHLLGLWYVRLSICWITPAAKRVIQKISLVSSTAMA
ncbi:MAG: hypothetical protein Q8O18_06010 [Deltaproteobacteria bacterium]|nr:hypothetical protein [Deltaproteobacteria bacterium]